MALDVTRAGAKGRRPSNRGVAYGRISRGVEIVQKWPRARGKKLHPKTKEQNEYFRQVQWAFKLSSAWVQRSYTQAVAGTPLMPRDLFLMAASGRMHIIIDSAGRKWFSMPAIKNISDSLDVIAQLPGQLIFRRADRWAPIALGAPGQVLTLDAETNMPVWADPAAGSGGTGGTGGTPAAWGSITGTLADQSDLEAALTAHALLDGGNALTGNQAITGDVTIDGSLTVNGVAVTGDTSGGTSGAAAWGSITGTLADQSDLEAALAAKLTVTPDPIQSEIFRIVTDAPVGLFAEEATTGARAGIEIQNDGLAVLSARSAADGETLKVALDTTSGYIEMQGSLPYRFVTVPQLVDGEIYGTFNLNWGANLDYDPVSRTLSASAPASGAGGSLRWFKPPLASTFPTMYASLRGGNVANALALSDDPDAGLGWHDPSTDNAFIKAIGRPIPADYIGGTFTITAHILFNSVQANDQCGLWAKSSNGYYVFLDFFNRGGTVDIQRAWQGTGWADGNFDCQWNGQEGWLRLTINGQQTSYYVSADGKRWLKVYTTDNLFNANFTDYGLCFGRFTLTDWTATCDYFASDEFPA